MNQTNLEDANLSECNLDRASLTLVYGNNVDLSNSILTGANLNLSTFRLANLDGSNTYGAIIKGTVMPDGRMSL